MSSFYSNKVNDKLETIIQIDPQILEISQAQINGQPITESVEENDSLLDLDENELLESKSKRVVPSAKNAPWGFVDGVKKGSIELGKLILIKQGN